MAARRDPIPVLEWIAAAVGLLVAAALIVVIGREALGRRDRDVPLLAAHLEDIVRTPDGHVARIRVTNRSGQTAAAVQIEGKLGDETSSATLDYVPGHSEARGGLMFAGDPAAQTLELRVTGYELP